MNKVKGFFHDWSIFRKVWLVFMCSLMIVIWFINGDTSSVPVLSLTGSLNLVLGARGKVAGLYFAIINSALYAYQYLGIPLYGKVMYNALYSIPANAAAIYLWNRNTTSDGGVRFRAMTPKLVAGVAVATTVGVWGYSELSKYIGGSFVFMDSLTTVVSVIIGMLYLLHYFEQWLMWVIVSALSIIMWIMVFVSEDTMTPLIIMMKTVNLLNSLYKCMNRRKISQEIMK